jgi:DNA (cytosine-5)-methyltransferase 1
MDKYARQTYIENYGEPDYYPADVYDREIPKESLDIYMTSPPCQAFSMAGKRLGKEDKRGILFFNSHEFIQKNNPRYFIFENVKGLLSHDEGKTFQEWINYLGGKSINGLPVLFPDENAVPYHLYYKVLNSKKLNVPQNRERIFIIGIRDDQDNFFQFPKDESLTKKLKDVLQDEADEKYFLSDKIIKEFFKTDKYIKVKSATKKGYEIAKEGDSINLSVPNSETRRGRVGKEVAQTLDTQCNQASFQNGLIRRLTPRECFRLMDFPDSFKWPVSDSQAYKQNLSTTRFTSFVSRTKTVRRS